LVIGCKTDNRQLTTNKANNRIKEYALNRFLGWPLATSVFERLFYIRGNCDYLNVNMKTNALPKIIGEFTIERVYFLFNEIRQYESQQIAKFKMLSRRMKINVVFCRA
jgi:predicted phosphodiesterase